MSTRSCPRLKSHLWQPRLWLEEEKFLVDHCDRLSSSPGDHRPSPPSRQENQNWPGEDVFQLYDTYGLPLELIREITLKRSSFVSTSRVSTKRWNSNAERSRKAGGETRKELVAVREALRDGGKGSSSVFAGYQSPSICKGHRSPSLARSEKGRYRSQWIVSKTGDHGIVVLDKTPFYAESGGQVGDRGHLIWQGGAAAVVDTLSEPSGTRFHFVDVESGSLDREGQRQRPCGRFTWRRYRRSATILPPISCIWLCDTSSVRVPGKPGPWWLRIACDSISPSIGR